MFQPTYQKEIIICEIENIFAEFISYWVIKQYLRTLNLTIQMNHKKQRRQEKLDRRIGLRRR